MGWASDPIHIVRTPSISRNCSRIRRPRPGILWQLSSDARISLISHHGVGHFRKPIPDVDHQVELGPEIGVAGLDSRIFRISKGCSKVSPSTVSRTLYCPGGAIGDVGGE